MSSSIMSSNAETPSIEQPHQFSLMFKVIFAILIIAIGIFFFYSCNQLKNNQRTTADFLTEYNSTTQSFSKSLEQCLRKEITSEDFRKTILAVHLPAIKSLKAQYDALPSACLDYLVSPNELRQVIDKYLELNELLADDVPEHQEANFEKFYKLLDEINELRKAIYNENLKYQ